MKYIITLLLITMASCQSASNKDISKSIVGKWTITNINSKKTLEKAPPFIEFKSDGKISGFNGCNNFFGGYTVKENKVSFTQFGSTKMFCQQEANNFEQGFNKTISLMDKIEVNDDQLTITSKENETIKAKRN